MRQSERQAHLSSALGLRRTAHRRFKLAEEYPDDRDHQVSEAKRLLRHAMWDIAQVRNIDRWIEWRKTNGA